MTYLDFFPVPMGNDAAVTAALIVGVSGMVLAIGFVIAEPRSPVARAVALYFGASGLSMLTSPPLTLIYEATGQLHWLARVPVIDLVLFWSAGLFLLRLARMAQPTPRALAWVQGCVWTIWFATLAVCVLDIYFPAERLTEFYYCLGRPEGCGQAGFWIFAIPWTLFGSAALIGSLILSTHRIDPAQRIRAIALATAVPFLSGALNLPIGYHALSMMLGYLIYALGMIRYYSMLGARAQFLSRFMSPAVERLVRYRGLDQLMQPKSLEITAVSCDLRGFTRLSLLLASDQVVRLLNEYYEVVDEAVGEFGGTIKDYAGDGVLILVGAPLAASDHATQGVALAHRLQQVIHQVIGHWAGPELKVGVGVGVASGTVTVGAIGGRRMEYTAIGPAVNLAARLCAHARDGEILVGARTAELAGSSGLEAREAISLKGMGKVSHFAVAMPPALCTTT